jgi:hypothetical protein
MEVIHERCAGLDVHKGTVVGCLRVRERGQVRGGRGDVHYLPGPFRFQESPDHFNRAIDPSRRDQSMSA